MTRIRPNRKWHRVTAPKVFQAAYPDTHTWQRDLTDGHLSVMVGREQVTDQSTLWHLSISHRTNTNPPKPGRYPTWDEIVEARYRFVPDEVTMAMLLPPRAEYIDVHPTTFHLWEVDL